MKTDAISISTFSDSDIEKCLAIAATLPQWFTAKGLRLMRTDLHYQKGLVALKNNQWVGFLSYFVNQAKAEIGWMGVLPEFHRNGLGKLLLKQLAFELTEFGITELYVKTLGDSVEYAPYEKTRAFYRANGFYDFERIHHPDNPEQEEELVLLKAIE